MKRKKLLAMITVAALAAGLAACGREKEPEQETPSQEARETLQPSQPPEATPESTPESTPQATAVPAQTGQIVLLCQETALTGEQEKEIKETLTTLYQNLELTEYLGEAIHMVAAAEWLETMGGEPGFGTRTYTMQKDGLPFLTVKLEEDKTASEVSSDITFLSPSGGLTELKQQGTVTWLLQAASLEGAPEGEGESWEIDSARGSIIRRQGTYSKGVPTGEFTVWIYNGRPGDAYDLWTNREGFTYQASKAVYDANGNEIPAATATPAPATPVPPTAAPATATPVPSEDSTTEPDGNAPGEEENPAQTPDGEKDVEQEWSPDLD